MRIALFLSSLLLLATTSIASAHYNGCPHRHYGPNGMYVENDPYCAPRHVYPRDEYDPPRRYYEGRDYYEPRRPGVGVDVPGGPSIRFRF